MAEGESPTRIGRYVVRARLGSGATGTVYLAEHEALAGGRFAVKTLHPACARDPVVLERFRREAALAARLSHPNLVPVIDGGTTGDGTTYLVMKHVAGRTLREILEAEAPLAPARAASLVRQLALGLAHVHEKGLVHRDVKPGNVLVAVEDGREVPRLCDFGMVGALDEATTARLTADGHTLGTPLYMAPEQVHDAQVGPEADLYALGAMLHQMLAGRPPFSGDAAEVLEAKLRRDAPRLPERTGLESLAWRLLAPHPDDRIRSAREVVTLVDGILAGRKPEPKPAPPKPRRSRRPVLVAAALAAATLLGAAAAWLVGR